MPRARKVQQAPETPVVEDQPRSKAGSLDGKAGRPSGKAEPKVLEDQAETPPSLTKADYLRARATIKSYREAQKNKPKRQCSERQLEALRLGREKNARCKKKKDTPVKSSE